MASSLPGPAVSKRPAIRAATLALSDLPRRFGRYVLLRRIAKGGMGEVMLAATLGLEGAERPLIIKTIRTEHRTDKSFKARFLDEARVQAQLEHPGVCQVLEATTDDESGEPYVVVEYVDGRSLGDVRARSLTTGQRIEWHEAVAIGQLAAEALSHVHDRLDPQGRPLAIVHRDLSPQNVMIGHGGEVKIIDFGTARGENRRCHTVSGVVFAKPGYVAPEVANGNPGDFRVDLYALGVMIWELCAGRRFLQGDATDHMAAVAKNDRNLPAIADVSGAPRALDDVIGRLTAFDRDARYTKTKVVARDLAALLGSAPPLPGGDRGVRTRVASVMARMFEGDSAKNRREFLRMVDEARKIFHSSRTPQAATPSAARAMKEERDGMVPGTRYRMVREIARGAGSVVHEVEHVDLGRRAAVKILEGTTSETRAMAACRLRHEARILSTLDIEGVVRVIDLGETSDQRPFAVLELCEGPTLADRMQRGEMTIRDALDVADRLLEVLGRVHDRGIIHRDIKPANIVLGEGARLTLVDFGIALSRTEADMSDLETPAPKGPTITLYGTPEYMAPEQAARAHEVDVRVDIYAVGAILYELLTGRLPFTGASAVAILEAKSQGSPEAPSERAKARAIPPEVDALCTRALARHPSLRFATATEMRAAVREAIDAPARRRTSRRKAGRYALVATMVGALAVVGVGAVRYPNQVHELTGVSVPWHQVPSPIATEAVEPTEAITSPDVHADAVPKTVSAPPKSPEQSADASSAETGPPSLDADDSPVVDEPVAEPDEKKAKPRRAEKKSEPDKKKGRKPVRPRKGKTKKDER